MPIPLDRDGQPDLAAALEINQLDLELEIAMCAADFYRVACMATDAKDTYESASMNLEIYEAQLAENIQLNSASELTKKSKKDITQTEIKRQFRDDPKWQALRANVLKLQHECNILEKATKAFEMKSHMLTSLNKRQLAKAGMGISSLINDDN